MPTYYINRFALSHSGRSTISNEQHQPAFLIVGRWGQKGDSFSVFQMNGSKIASIKQTTSWLRPCFDLYYQQKKVGRLQHLLSYKRDYYFINGLNWTVSGEIFYQQYRIQHFNHCLMTIMPDLKSTNDLLLCQIESADIAPLCFCIAAALDYWLKNPDQKRLNWLSAPVKPLLE